MCVCMRVGVRLITCAFHVHDVRCFKSECVSSADAVQKFGILGSERKPQVCSFQPISSSINSHNAFGLLKTSGGADII